jgi:proteasome lid subunit RPN8/RPN11
VSRTTRIKREILAKVLSHAKRAEAQECCGVLAGTHGLISRIFSASNVAPNPATNYEIAPQEVCAFMRQMRLEKIEFLGIYHSHPNGKNEPSRRDIERAYYSEVAYFIVSTQTDPPVRAFSIKDGQVEELRIEIELRNSPGA